MMANANDPRIFRIVSQMLKIVLTAGHEAGKGCWERGHLVIDNCIRGELTDYKATRFLYVYICMCVCVCLFPLGTIILH